MHPVLVPLNEGPRVVIDRPIVLVGRHRECDVCIDSPRISRRHCCLAQVNDEIFVRDLGSTNGVRVNGRRVRQRRLRAGDELRISHLAWRLECPAGG